jgi:hypothetical protein
MNIISIETGRVTWLFPTEEIVPLGGLDGMAALRAVAERYQFKNFPENPAREEIDKNGLKFSTGMFESADGRFGVGEFALFNDGMVALSNTTEHSSAFLQDVFDFVVAEFGFRRPISPIKKVAVSVVIVEFDHAVSNMLANQSALLSLISGYLNELSDTTHGVEVTRLDFTLNDPAATGALNSRPRFILESRAGTPLLRRRYYSNATMPTRAHLELLSKIEENFMRDLSSPRTSPSLGAV